MDRGELTDLNAVLTTLAGLDRLYRESLTVADRHAALRQSVARLIESGVLDVAWAGEPGDGPDLTIGVTAGTRTDLLTGLPVPSGSGLTGKVYEHAAMDWVNEYATAPSITHEFDRHIQAESIQRLIAIPIVHDGRTLGVLAAGARKAGAFGDRAIEQVVAAANSAAFAVTAAERARHAAELAVHEERRRVALELHDTVGALLYAIGSGLRGLREPSAPETADRITALEAQTAEASRFLRDALRALHASPTELALTAAVHAECRALEERTAIQTHVLTLGDLPPLSREVLEPITRAVREALHNVEKHAAAQSVAVTLSATENEVVIAVTDDGTGFDPDPATAGIGLAGSAHALGAIGGALDVQANPDGGTRWRARIPR
ncbi:GAF domain-containing sensor histidine kinase [Amycolatopsis jejuensis]|uniref:GAF domain-containing sensor histidine kinase n=1 Tax=Amycolatopsis jejuensis TaxID=330084 RepID=UPI00068F0077|nr:GAF domain-containing protein [Amycolatopsis jejuensis]